MSGRCHSATASCWWAGTLAQCCRNLRVCERSQKSGFFLKMWHLLLWELGFKNIFKPGVDHQKWQISSKGRFQWRVARLWSQFQETRCPTHSLYLTQILPRTGNLEFAFSRKSHWAFRVFEDPTHGDIDFLHLSPLRPPLSPPTPPLSLSISLCYSCCLSKNNYSHCKCGTWTHSLIQVIL